MNEKPPFTRNYAVVAIIILFLPMAMMAEDNIPAWALHSAMLFALLVTGRLFYTKFARAVWIIGLAMNVIRLLLAGVLLIRF